MSLKKLYTSAYDIIATVLRVIVVYLGTNSVVGFCERIVIHAEPKDSHRGR
jgi:hypothetical protein